MLVEDAHTDARPTVVRHYEEGKASFHIALTSI